MNFLLELPLGLIAFWAAVLGAAVGSFLNVVIHRVPKGLSLLYPPSSCPHCGRRIRPWNNIPILSYLLLRGKCPNCGGAISIRYPVVELLGAVAAVWPLLLFGAGWDALAGALLGWHLIALAVIDLETWTIPDHVVLPMGLAGLAVALGRGGGQGVLTALIACAIGVGFQLLIYAVSRFILRRDGIGSGDITMTAAFSLYLDPLTVPLALISAAVFGLLGSGTLAMLRRKKIRGEDQVPFGPYLALGAWVAFLYGGVLVSAYVNWVLGRL